MNYNEAELRIRQELKGIYEDGEASAIASMIIEQLTGLTRAERMVRHESLTNEQERTLGNYITRLQQQEPIQYITGNVWFSGMNLYVNQNVLIPRPETEELVQWIIEDARQGMLPVFEKNATDADATQLLKILDIGTGSGCIALALKKAMPLAEVWGCDVIDEALNVARRNGSALDIRVDFQQVDFLEEDQQKQLPTVDIIVSNPPYVPQKDKASMQPNVLNYEPHTALFVPDNDALIFYKAIIAFGDHRLHKKGKIYLEIHEELGNDVLQLFRDKGYYASLRRDMQGKDRMVKAEKK